MTFIVDLYDFETGAEHHVLTTPGDYIRMSTWSKDNLTGDEDTGLDRVRDLRKNYAATWFALKRRDRLAEFGLANELSIDAIDAMADRFSIFVRDVEDGSLPLKEERAI